MTDFDKEIVEKIKVFENCRIDDFLKSKYSSESCPLQECKLKGYSWCIHTAVEDLGKPSSAYEIPEVQDAKRTLNTTRTQLDTVDIEQWKRFTNKTNDTGFAVEEIRKKLKADSRREHESPDGLEPEMITGAWIKMMELYTSSKVIRHEDAEALQARGGTYRTCHLCECPGGFICATNHYLKTYYPNLKWFWRAVSLNPYNEANNLNAMIDDDAFYRQTPEHWWRGADDTGNVMSKENWKHCFSETLGRRMDPGNLFHIVTADGSIDSQHDANDQENITAGLHFCEFFWAITLLRPGGSFVQKAFTLFEHHSASLLFLFNLLFEKVAISKPKLSKAGNGETYIIGLRFKGLRSLLMSKLKEFVRMDTDHSVPIVPESWTKGVKRFHDQHVEFANYFASMQESAINANWTKWVNSNGMVGQADNKLYMMNKHSAAKVVIDKIDLQHLKVDQRILKIDRVGGAEMLYGGKNNSTRQGRRKKVQGIQSDRADFKEAYDALQRLRRERDGDPQFLWLSYEGTSPPPKALKGMAQRGPKAIQNGGATSYSMRALENGGGGHAALPSVKLEEEEMQAGGSSSSSSAPKRRRSSDGGEEEGETGLPRAVKSLKAEENGDEQMERENENGKAENGGAAGGGEHDGEEGEKDEELPMFGGMGGWGPASSARAELIGLAAGKGTKADDGTRLRGFGKDMLKKMGWEEGKGLGAQEQGISTALDPKEHGRRGLGYHQARVHGKNLKLMEMVNQNDPIALFLMKELYKAFEPTRKPEDWMPVRDSWWYRAIPPKPSELQYSKFIEDEIDEPQNPQTSARERPPIIEDLLRLRTELPQSVPIRFESDFIHMQPCGRGATAKDTPFGVSADLAFFLKAWLIVDKHNPSKSQTVGNMYKSFMEVNTGSNLPVATLFTRHGVSGYAVLDPAVSGEHREAAEARAKALSDDRKSEGRVKGLKFLHLSHPPSSSEKGVTSDRKYGPLVDLLERQWKVRADPKAGGGSSTGSAKNGVDFFFADTTLSEELEGGGAPAGVFREYAYLEVKSQGRLRLLSSLILGLNSVNTRGVCLFRMGSALTRFTAGLILVLSMVFKKVLFYRPVSTPHWTGLRYLVCQGVEEKHRTMARPFFQKLYNAVCEALLDRDKDGRTFIPESVPCWMYTNKVFISWLREVNALLGNRERDDLAERLRLHEEKEAGALLSGEEREEKIVELLGKEGVWETLLPPSYLPDGEAEHAGEFSDDEDDDEEGGETGRQKLKDEDTGGVKRELSGPRFEVKVKEEDEGAYGENSPPGSPMAARDVDDDEDDDDDGETARGKVKVDEGEDEEMRLPDDIHADVDDDDADDYNPYATEGTNHMRDVDDEDGEGEKGATDGDADAGAEEEEDGIDMTDIF
uniref:Cap-specific mRNA (nucleoside-2'-O-)-methyltransferase 2 n=1 Tax=Chromera velia CCMP2878 TaxID=1169474 RepID=A0A0G4GIJ3_9ALVE|eukprot:Cvel_4770.t1-p1 / transcript=Cvel_4770.t1 / gene=Cvel_4770 / organism=Chromera_velia_CCMP2878 / gene_product=FtsJ methyltransferase domain-containing protein 1, putative / transcript_product=FtsJ methyltransferase domain-containing protein 1, putative / location=Cvel_scaffold212:103315-112167(+) / protein_length=1377 / sequence_SO=supercontig / SO=protein_coding / is_pseudo=false